MKKIIAIMLALLLTVMLTACVEEPPAPTDPATEAPTTASGNSTSTEPGGNQDQPAVDPTDAPTEAPTAPDQEQTLAAQFQEMLSSETNYWYNRILGCTFADAKSISLEYLFYNGLAPEDRTDSASFTDDEVAFLKDALKDTFWGEENWTNAHKMPVAEINEVLNTYLGVSLEDLRIPENWLYFADTDSYYCVKTDSFSVGSYQVIHVQEYEDGTVEIFWTVDLHYDTTAGDYENEAEMLLTLRKVEDHYVAVSNLPLPETEK